MRNGESMTDPRRCWLSIGELKEELSDGLAQSGARNTPSAAPRQLRSDTSCDCVRTRRIHQLSCWRHIGPVVVCDDGDRMAAGLLGARDDVAASAGARDHNSSRWWVGALRLPRAAGPMVLRWLVRGVT
ncbi:hypothetical protein KKA53_05165 [Candidatus Dependentiae bacterium]|nr:hypothetical protein [Candidatus Dependentiae bacterium]